MYMRIYIHIYRKRNIELTHSSTIFGPALVCARAGVYVCGHEYYPGERGGGYVLVPDSIKPAFVLRTRF